MKKAVIITRDCRGSEDGRSVRDFKAGPDPIQVEASLADVFIGLGNAKDATAPASAPPDPEKAKAEPGPTVTKEPGPAETGEKRTVAPKAAPKKAIRKKAAAKK